MKIALVHDYLREYGGAERVIEALHELFPTAPLYTAFVDKKALGIHWQKFADWDIRETWIADLPFCKKLFSPYRLFAPAAFEDLDLSEYDVVISSSNAYFSKAVVVPNGVHVCYCHTPARSLYGYSTMTDWKSSVFTKLVGSLINHYLRIIDFEVAQRVNVFIANSKETQTRIKKFYRRDAVLVYPPVKLPEKVDSKQRQSALKQGYYLYVNRLAFAKHPEMAVQVCSQLGLTLKVVGDGKLRAELEKQAGPTVSFHGSVTDEELQELYKHAKMLLYPVEDEDFGIVPVEAMGHGVPVVAHNSGGPRETVKDGSTGILFDELSVEALATAIKCAQAITFKTGTLTEHARTYSVATFQKKIRELVHKHALTAA